MNLIGSAQSTVALLLGIAALVLEVFAFVDAIRHRADAYQADLHHGAEAPGRDLDSALAQRVHDRIDHRLGHLAGGGAVPGLSLIHI